MFARYGLDNCNDLLRVIEIYKNVIITFIKNVSNQAIDSFFKHEHNVSKLFIVIKVEK